MKNYTMITFIIPVFFLYAKNNFYSRNKLRYLS
jgi:hypothetical protein